MVKLYKKTFRTERRLNFKVHVSVNCLPVDMCMQIQAHTCTSSVQYTLCILDHMIFSPFPVNVQHTAFKRSKKNDKWPEF